MSGLGGLVDLHSHILFGLDDGAKNIKESLELLKALEAKGFVHAILTPHHIQGVYEVNPEMLAEKLNALKQRCESEGLRIKLSVAVEYFFDHSLIEIIDSGKAMFINPQNRTLLVQAPMLKTPTYIDQLAFELKLRRVTPIIAHPERYTDVAKKPQKIKEFLKRGFLVQLNLGSLGGLYGEQVRLAAEKLIRYGHAHFVATDLHAPHHVDIVLNRGLARLLQLKKENGVKILMSTNPLKVMSGDSLAEFIWG